jgi:regulator of protease activity HflC (stomatin/prohibitin superfamily)
MSDEREIDFGAIIKVVLIVAVVIFAIMCFIGVFVSVPAGNVGVADTFGTVDPTPWQPGLHIKAPWTSVIMFSTQTQKYTEGSGDVATVSALSNEGLTVSMGVALNYHIVGDNAPEIYKSIGTDYKSVVMLNPIHSVPRDIISKYDAKTLYSAMKSDSNPDRIKIEQELYDGIEKGLNTNDGKSRGIVIEKVFLRNIDLPKTLTDSIEAKLSMEQQIAQKQFEVQKQQMEAERVTAEAEGVANKVRIEAQANADKMRIEAQGQADANAKVASSINDNIMAWQFIQTMKDNPRAIYIPVGDNGLPIFKNADATAST